jgi:acyl-CoA thioesterase FadM
MKNIHNNNLILNATTTVVAIDKDGKLLKKMPEYLYDKYQKILPNKTELSLI